MNVPWEFPAAKRQADQEEAHTNGKQDEADPIKGFDLIPPRLSFLFDILVDWVVKEQQNRDRCATCEKAEGLSNARGSDE